MASIATSKAKGEIQSTAVPRPGMPVMQISHPKMETFMLEVINSDGGNCNSMAG
jgi:hypothetical protein